MRQEFDGQSIPFEVHKQGEVIIGKEGREQGVPGVRVPVGAGSGWGKGEKTPGVPVVPQLLRQT